MIRLPRLLSVAFVLLSATLFLSCLKDTFGDIDYGQLSLRKPVYEMPCTGQLRVPVFYGSKRVAVTMADTSLAKMTFRTYSDMYSNLWEENQTVSILLEGRNKEGETFVGVKDLRTQDSVAFKLRFTAGYVAMLVSRSTIPVFKAKDPQMLLFIDGHMNAYLFHLKSFQAVSQLTANELAARGAVALGGAGKSLSVNLTLGDAKLNLAADQTGSEVLAYVFHMLGVKRDGLPASDGTAPKNTLIRFVDAASDGEVDFLLQPLLSIPDGVMAD